MSDYCKCGADLDDDEACTCEREPAPDPRDVEIARLRADNAALLREVERWRHGVTVEGDFICPDTLIGDELAKAAEPIVLKLRDGEGIVPWNEVSTLGKALTAWSDTRKR